MRVKYCKMHDCVLKLILLFLAFASFRPFFTFIPITPLLESLVLSLIFITSYKVLCYKAIVFFLIYYLLVFIDLFVCGNTFMQGNLYVVFTFSMELSFLFIVYYFVKISLDDWVKATKYVCTFILLSALITFFFNLKQPGFYRNVELEREEFRMVYEARGVLSYYMFHAIALLFPFLILVWKLDKSKVYRNVSILLLFLFIYLMFSSSITTAVALGGISIVLALNTSTNKKQIGLILFLFIVGLWGKSIVLGVIDFLLPFAEGTGMYQKLDVIRLGVSYGDQIMLTNGRSNLYGDSWDAFCNNPFLGCHNANLLGEHSFIIDRLGFYGLIGFLPYLIFLFLQIKMPLKYISPYIRPYYYWSYFPYIGMMFLKNIHLYEMYCVVFIVVPGLYIWASKRYFPSYLK